MTTVDDIDVARGLIVSVIHEAQTASAGYHRWTNEGNKQLADECHERGVVYTQAGIILNMLLLDAENDSTIRGGMVIYNFEMMLAAIVNTLTSDIKRLRQYRFNMAADLLDTRRKIADDLKTIVHVILVVDTN